MAFSYSVRLNDPFNYAGSQSSALLADVNWALSQWSQYINGLGTLAVTVNVKTGLGGGTLANAGPTASPVSGTLDGRPLDLTSSLYELTTGQHAPGAVDANGNVADIQVNVNADQIPNFFINPSPSAGATVPSNKWDLSSVLLHELAHGLGFTGNRLDSTGGFPSSNTSETRFDHYVVKAADGSFTFTGPNAMAVYGGPVPLTGVNTGEAIYHFGGSQDSWLRFDLMSGTGLYNGKSEGISSLDLAVLKDAGVPINSLAGTPVTSYAVVAVSADKAEGTGGVTPFTFKVVRSGDTGSAATIAWQTGYPGGAGSAGFDDFQNTSVTVGNTTTTSLPSGTVTFAAGDTEKLFTVPVLGDAAVEPDETFYVFINGQGANSTLNVTSNVANGVIRDDDVPTTPGFDRAYYLSHNPDVAAAGADPLQHFQNFGWREGRNPSALFDTRYYLAQNPDVRSAGINPLQHFITYGWAEGRQPSLLFDDAKYLTANPDVKAAGIDPLVHYMAYGQSEGRISFLTGGTAAADPLVNAAYYNAQLGATLLPTGTAASQQAAWSYDNGGWQRGLNPDAFFDTNYYLSHNADVAAAHVDPLLHFETFGWKEGRDPSAQFSISKYLAAYTDVKNAGVDPLLHYVVYGQPEGRSAFHT